MSLTRPQFSINSSRRGGARLTCAILCFLFLSAVPALAEPVRINQVVQTLSTSQGVPDLKINSLITQDSGQKGTQQNGPRSDNGSGAKTDSIITGVTVTGQGQQIGVETIAEGEVEGSICDCGEIYIAGGFPKWPFLFLGAIPLAFIDSDCDDCDTPTPTPTPTPPSTPTPTPTPTPQVPEPASLLLFGTGLAAAAAGLRRRYAKARVVEAEEERQ